MPLLLAFLMGSLPAVAEDCPGRDLTALRMSSVFYQGERVRPFLLNTDGGAFTPCSGQTPLLGTERGANDEIIAGVSIPLDCHLEGTNGNLPVGCTIHRVDYETLIGDSNRYAESLEAYTALPDAPYSLEEVCDETDSHFRSQLEDIARLGEELVPNDPEREDVLKMVYKFNSNIETCNMVNESDDRRNALGEAWEEFCQTQESQSLCQRAMEVDLITRTAAFEADELGVMDEVELEDPFMARSMEFPVSRCEKRFIASTLRNRRSRSSNRFGSPYLVDALNPDIYQIWKPEFVRNSFIAACFSEDAYLPEGVSDFAFEKYHLFRQSYLDSLGDVYNTLFNPEAMDATMEYTNATTGETQPIQQSVRHYYHPMAMDKCFFEDGRQSGWEIHRMSVGTVACRDLPQGRDCALFKNEPHRVNSSTGEIQFVHRSNETGNFQYTWREENPPWIIQRSMYDMDPRNYFPGRRATTGEHIASDLVNRGSNREPRRCENFAGNSPVGNMSPHWAWNRGTPNYFQLTCNFEDGSSASIGGLNQPQIVPVLSTE